MITPKINHKWLKLNQVIMHNKAEETNTDKNINRDISLYFLYSKTLRKELLKKVLTVRVGHDILI